jgi:hypothetical protein
VRLRLAIAVISCCLAVVGCERRHEQPRTTNPAPTALPGEARDLGLTRRLPAAYLRACTEQADYAPAGARLCPPLVPEGPMKVMTMGPFSKSPRDRGAYLADLSSSSLSELGADHIETNLGHWHYDVSWTPATRHLLVRRFVERPVNSSKASACRHLRLGRELVEACRVVPHAQGGDLHGGHIAYMWTYGRVSYVLSLHGYANEPRARAMTRALMARRLGN